MVVISTKKNIFLYSTLYLFKFSLISFCFHLDKIFLN